jgi:DNA-binding GntR family transcriptional regulator
MRSKRAVTEQEEKRIIAFPSIKPLVEDEEGEARTLHHGIAATLRELIIHNQLPPGKRLTEQALCERLEVSRTPLREALKVLAHEGLVEILPNRGARVVQLTREDVRHLFEVIGALESMGGRLACEQMTDAELCDLKAIHYQMKAGFLRRDLPDYFRNNQAIHERIIAYARNPVLISMHQNLNRRLLRARYLASQTDESRWAAAMEEHEMIIDALERRSANELAEILLSHLRHKYEAICRHLGEAQLE